ncbi:hypothetical protein B0T26DRAFT_317785 [Lasiosphaeria miniovina]|uniref:Uncharacterized protein n=1 Tax=Lasiosphaeria miniovina TaxID=1954250 RepID=A0AA40DVS9_9PEZI|nr:uncharacterized protein B0T26DRAFT_317785 [Lasiosphaeria miniovina]KAK0718174.1 hypothetical protein B0T26DRAFT_317785 [Lasiosphaeria miniovina]
MRGLPAAVLLLVTALDLTAASSLELSSAELHIVEDRLAVPVSESPPLEPTLQEPAEDYDETLIPFEVLSELELLRMQLAELQDEIFMREMYLEEIFPVVAVSSDCSGLKCALKSIWRKASDAAASLYGGDDEDEAFYGGHWGRWPHFRHPKHPHCPKFPHHGNHTHGNHTFPHPPWWHPHHGNHTHGNHTFPHPPWWHPHHGNHTHGNHTHSNHTHGNHTFPHPPWRRPHHPPPFGRHPPPFCRCDPPPHRRPGKHPGDGPHRDWPPHRRPGHPGDDPDRDHPPHRRPGPGDGPDEDWPPHGSPAHPGDGPHRDWPPPRRPGHPGDGPDRGHPPHRRPGSGDGPDEDWPPHGSPAHPGDGPHRDWPPPRRPGHPGDGPDRGHSPHRRPGSGDGPDEDWPPHGSPAHPGDGPHRDWPPPRRPGHPGDGPDEDWPPHGRPTHPGDGPDREWPPRRRPGHPGNGPDREQPPRQRPVPGDGPDRDWPPHRRPDHKPHHPGNGPGGPLFHFLPIDGHHMPSYAPPKSHRARNAVFLTIALAFILVVALLRKRRTARCSRLCAERRAARRQSCRDFFGRWSYGRRQLPVYEDEKAAMLHDEGFEHDEGTLAQEIASFRVAAELVDSMVAAEEGRALTQHKSMPPPPSPNASFAHIMSSVESNTEDPPAYEFSQGELDGQVVADGLQYMPSSIVNSGGGDEKILGDARE